MKIGKIIISILLMLTYSVGFAHNLVPHCQEMGYEFMADKSVQAGHHHHKHHQNKLSENSDSVRDYISHSNHYDAGIYDLLLCILNEFGHPATDCNMENYIPVKSNDATTINLSKVKLIVEIIIFIPQTDSQSKSSIVSGTDVSAIYFSPQLKTFSLRGPPLFTC
jgi:hypothetical protein